MKELIKRPFRPVISYFGKKKINKNFVDPPVLIGGCARSGTSLLQIILSSHPELFVFPGEISAFSSWEKDKSGNSKAIRLDKLHRQVMRYKIPENARRWCSKAPSNIRHIEEINKYFNNKVKFIHIVRDVRDVILSKHPKKPGESWVKPERWIRDVKAGLKYEDHPNVYTIKYENLVNNFDEEITGLCDFIGISYDKRMKDWIYNKQINKSDAIKGEISDIYSSSIGKWKNQDKSRNIEEVMKNPEVIKILKRLNYKI